MSLVKLARRKGDVLEGRLNPTETNEVLGRSEAQKYNSTHAKQRRDELMQILISAAKKRQPPIKAVEMCVSGRFGGAVIERRNLK